MDVSGFEWDAGNTRKCQKHGVSIAEIEEIFTRPVIILPDHPHSIIEERSIALGRTEVGRNLFVIFTIREHDGLKFIRPISARYMHQGEVESYEKDNPDL